jgi:type IV secretory pathway VirB9-like protein
MTLPTAMIKDAQRAAHVEPQRRGYHGASATQRWIWQPGKLYVVYVCPSQMTKIATPPGELLISKVFLDPDAWDVQSYRVGNESLTQDVVFVRPQEGKGAKDVDVALLTEQGHSYDIHLKVGTVCMFGVTWDTPSVPQIVQDEAPLRSTP